MNSQFFYFSFELLIDFSLILWLCFRINPVTGCYEEPRPNPMEGMTQEQKEYEAIRLVEMIDKLAK